MTDSLENDKLNLPTNKSKNKIVLMGMVGIHNYGDNFIAKCTEYLVNEIGNFDISIVDLASPLSVFKTFIYGCMYFLSQIIPDNVYRAKLVNFAVKFRCKRSYEKALKDAAALIFDGGSFKYGTQKVWAYYSLAIEIANSRSIPVMFNAMNVQKFDNESWKCHYLRDHANLPCVKVFTTRDGDTGVRRLYHDYQIRKDLVCEEAGDSAFWIPQCYKLHKKEDREIIGINLIEGDIFQRYGNVLCEDELVNIYCVLLKRLDEKNIQWELFTNGIKKDLKFGRKLLKRYGSPKKIIFVPKSDVELAEKISSYKVVLGARLHACICAYSLGIPFIGYIWDEKLKYFSKMIEAEDFFIKEDDLTGEKLVELLMELYNNGCIPNPKIRRKWMLKTKESLIEFLSVM